LENIGPRKKLPETQPKENSEQKEEKDSRSGKFFPKIIDLCIRDGAGSWVRRKKKYAERGAREFFSREKEGVPRPGAPRRGLFTRARASRGQCIPHSKDTRKKEEERSGSGIRGNERSIARTLGLMGRLRPGNVSVRYRRKDPTGWIEKAKKNFL